MPRVKKLAMRRAITADVESWGSPERGRGSTLTPAVASEAAPETAPEAAIGEDGPAGVEEEVVDDDCDIGMEDVEDDLDNDVEVNGVEEEVCSDLGIHFGEIARADRDGDVSDADSGDDIWNDEHIPDPISSDEDEEAVQRKVVSANTVDSEELLCLGKTFGCGTEFKTALLRYSLKTRYDIKLYKSSALKLGAKCCDTESKCPWRVYCSYEKRKHKLQIKVYVNEHVCIRSGHSSMLKRSTIAMLFEERLRVNPKLTKVEMAEEIKREYNLIVTEEQCAKAKSKLYRERKASHEAHFSRIWDYEAEIMRSNKDSTVVIETIPGATPTHKQRFDRMYICFTSQRESWLESCRPIIGLDGAFLKWDIKGHLLAAIGRDGDNRIVPIAWAVVEIENNVNWEWFVKLLKVDLGLKDGATTTIISDKQKGLLKAVKEELPEAEHRMCSRHILANWKRDSRDPELERLFWKIARSYTYGDYDDNLKTLKAYSTGAHESLLRTNPETWSRAFFSLGSCCNDNLNNLSESFNRTIREARKKPLLELLEDIRRQCMVRNAKRAVIASRLKCKFTKRTHKEIEESLKKSKEFKRFIAWGNVHEVDDHGCSYSVDMDAKTCGCIKWQLTGIPCAHAACVISAKKLQIDEFVSRFYTADMWRVTYSRGIKPVQGMKLWPRLNRLPVLPPPFRLGNRGRPSNYDRRKEPSESSSSNKLSRAKRVMTCSRYQQKGHNKTKCANPIVEKQPKRPRGRPRLHSQPHLSQGQSQGTSEEFSQGLSQSQV